MMITVLGDGMHLEVMSIFLGKSGFQCLIYMSLGPNPKPSSTRIRNANQFLCNQHQVLSFKFTSAHGRGRHIYYNNLKLKMFKTF